MICSRFDYKTRPGRNISIEMFQFQSGRSEGCTRTAEGGLGEESWSCFQWCPPPPLTRKIFAAGAAISLAAVDFAFETSATATGELGAGRGSKLFINNLLKGEFYLGTEFQGLPGLSLESVFSFALVFTCFSSRRFSGRLFV